MKTSKTMVVAFLPKTRLISEGKLLRPKDTCFKKNPQCLSNDRSLTYIEYIQIAVCTDDQLDVYPQAGGCPYWAALGYCAESSIYYQFMQSNCYASCSNCEGERITHKGNTQQ